MLLVSMMDPTNRVAGSAGIRNASESSRVHAKACNEDNSKTHGDTAGSDFQMVYEKLFGVT